MNNIAKGKKGEAIAKKYLQRNRYKIVGENYYSRWGEIDLIAYDRQDKELVFVEVKTRQNKKYGNPEDAVNEQKMEKLFKTAQTYLSDNDYQGNYRFDCLAIDVSEGLEIKHYKNIS